MKRELTDGYTSMTSGVLYISSYICQCYRVTCTPGSAN